MQSGFQEHRPGGTLLTDAMAQSQVDKAMTFEPSKVRPFISTFALPELWKFAKILGIPYVMRFTDAAHVQVINTVTAEVIRRKGVSHE